MTTLPRRLNDSALGAKRRTAPSPVASEMGASIVNPFGALTRWMLRSLGICSFLAIDNRQKRVPASIEVPLVNGRLVEQLDGRAATPHPPEQVATDERYRRRCHHQRSDSIDAS